MVNLFNEYFLRYAGQSVNDAFGHYGVVGGSVRPTKLLAVKFSSRESRNMQSAMLRSMAR